VLVENRRRRETKTLPAITVISDFTKDVNFINNHERPGTSDYDRIGKSPVMLVDMETGAVISVIILLTSFDIHTRVYQHQFEPLSRGSKTYIIKYLKPVLSKAIGRQPSWLKREYHSYF
jgi:hypothetical protein